MDVFRTLTRSRRKTGILIGRESIRLILKKRFSYYRPTGKLGADPEEISKAKEEIEKLKEKARKGE